MDRSVTAVAGGLLDLTGQVDRQLDGHRLRRIGPGLGELGAERCSAGRRQHGLIAERVPRATGQRQRPGQRHGHVVIGGGVLEDDVAERRTEAVEQVRRLLHGGERVPQRHGQPTVLGPDRAFHDPPGGGGVVENEAAGQAWHSVDDVLVDDPGDDHLARAVGVDRRIDRNVEATPDEHERRSEQPEPAEIPHLGKFGVRV